MAAALNKWRTATHSIIEDQRRKRSSSAVARLRQQRQQQQQRQQHEEQEQHDEQQDVARPSKQGFAGHTFPGRLRGAARRVILDARQRRLSAEDAGSVGLSDTPLVVEQLTSGTIADPAATSTSCIAPRLPAPLRSSALGAGAGSRLFRKMTVEPEPKRDSSAASDDASSDLLSGQEQDEQGEEEEEDDEDEEAAERALTIHHRLPAPRGGDLQSRIPKPRYSVTKATLEGASSSLKPKRRHSHSWFELHGIEVSRDEDAVDAAPPTGVDATANDSRNSSNREAGDEGDEDVDDNDDAKTQSLE